MNEMKTIHLMTVPFGTGGRKKGAEFGPEAVLKAGLPRHLKELGLLVHGPVEMPVPEAVAIPSVSTVSADRSPSPMEPPIEDNNLRYVQEVAEMNRTLASEVSAAVNNGRFPLVLGGDHSIAIGTIAGLAQHYHTLGVIWFDAHADLNTSQTSSTGNIHGMSLAVSLGIGDERLVTIGGVVPKIQPEHVVIIGARDLDEGEKKLIRALGIACFTMHDIDRLGMARVVEEALRIAGGQTTDGLHLSFDLDSLDPWEAPGTGTPVIGGVNYREAHLALEMLFDSGKVTSAEFVEMNPALDRDNQTARLAVGLIESLLGKKII